MRRIKEERSTVDMLREYITSKRKSLIRLSDFKFTGEVTEQDKFLGEYLLARMLRDESERIYDIAKANMLRDNLTGLDISTNTKNVKPGEAKRVGQSALFECVLGVQVGGTKIDMTKLAQILHDNGVPTGVVANAILAATVGTTPPKTYIVRPLHEPEQEEGSNNE